MIQLLILADDYTGALDCGAQLRKNGANVHIVGIDQLRFDRVHADTEVLVVNTDSRHITPAQAKKIVRDLCKSAREIGVRLFYKKTDSALRGNIGAELEGMLEGLNARRAYFVPAFPSIDRVTRQCVQYIDGVPLAESLFAQDPFEPAIESRVDRVINRQSDIPVCPVAIGAPLPAQYSEKDILVFDAEINKDMADIAASLCGQTEISLLAGCAGFAEFLPVFLKMQGTPMQPQLSGSGFIAISGTLCKTALQHIEQAEELGYSIIRLSAEQKLSGFLSRRENEALLEHILEQYRSNGRVIISAGSMASTANACSRAEESALIARNLGSLAKRLVEKGFDGTLLATGGDTLQGVLRALDSWDVIPVAEIEPGVEFSIAMTTQGQIPIVSKAGSMGSLNVYLHVADFLRKQHDKSQA
jgi:uncharacterized protein YgbK (DUF1537 family)